jgi:hypothetical protein
VRRLDAALALVLSLIPGGARFRLKVEWVADLGHRVKGVRVNFCGWHLERAEGGVEPPHSKTLREFDVGRAVAES